MLTHKAYMVINASISLAAHLSRLRERAGMSLDQVARAAGYKGRSSVQRYFEDSSITFLKPEIAAKFAKALYNRGNPPIDMEDLERLVLQRPAGVNFDHEVVIQLLDLAEVVYGNFPRSVEVAEIPYRKDEYLPIAGEAQATKFVERTSYDSQGYGVISFPFDTRNFEEDEYAIKIIGNSVNRVAPDGTYAICRAFGEGKHTYPSGKYVHVERARGDLMEWTVKKVGWDAGGMYLYPDSTDPAHQQPLSRDHDEFPVRVLGIVIAWYRDA